MLKRLRLHNKAVFILTVAALFLLSGCFDNNTAYDDAPTVFTSPAQNFERNKTGQIIEKKLDALVNGYEAQQSSSNPYDYLIGNRYYEDILMLGDDALRYMLKNLGTSQEDGLKEYIMASACCFLLGENPADKEWSTGQEWYRGFNLRRSELRSGGSNQEVVDFDHIYGSLAYPPDWPKLEIFADYKRIYWDRGDANYTGQAGELIGNTSFGMNEEWIDILRPNIVRPESQLVFKAAEVPGLDPPRYTLQQYSQGRAYILYPLQGNIMTAPAEEGEHVFILAVDWGRGNNTILYWFKLKVAA